MRKWRDWNSNLDEDGPGSRYTDRVEFVVGLGELEEGEARQREDSLVSAVAREFPDVEVSAARTSAGRGAAWEAVALAVAFASAPGGIYATWRVFSKIFNYLRSRGEHPSMSIGAIRHLCLADLLQSHPDLEDADVIEVVATEVSPPGPPSDLSHTGRDMFIVIFVKADNSCTWVFLVDGYGKVLHMGQGMPLTLDLAFESALSPEVWSTGTHRYIADPGSR